MINQFFNSQTNALFRMVYDEPVLDRNFYGKDQQEKVLTVAWNRGPDQVITIDNYPYTFPANTVHCLMTSENFHFERPENIVAWQFSREFYCIVDHDKEVSCVGFIFYGQPQKMFIRLNGRYSRQIENMLQMLQDEFEEADEIQGEMMR